MRAVIDSDFDPLLYAPRGVMRLRDCPGVPADGRVADAQDQEDVQESAGAPS